MEKRWFIGWLCACMLFTAACQKQESGAPTGSIPQEQASQPKQTQNGQQTDWKQHLIGTWQDSFEMAAGYTNLYQFKEDGTFRFTPNEMACDRRDAGYSGKWEIDGQKLRITVLKEREWVGGKLEPATGACSSELELVEATLQTKEVNPPRSMVFTLAAAEPSRSGYPAMKLGDARYWRILDKPLEESDSSLGGDDPQSPKELLRAKIPDARIVDSITEDLNHDQMKESVFLTEEGALYYLDANGELSFVAEQLVSEEGAGEPATIRVLPAVNKETHVAVIYSYFPSNTQIMVFAVRDGQLKKIFEVMGDQGIAVGANHTIIQHWKRYRQEGGWDLATTSYQWNEEKQEYVKGTTEIKQSE